MITSRSPKRTIARAWRCSSQSCAMCSSSCWCSAFSAASKPFESSRITRSLRSDSSSISCLISVSVRIPGKTQESCPVFLRISQLVEPVLLDPEVVGELMEDGDPDLLLELLRVGKRLHERLPVDRDRRREVFVRVEEAEEARVARRLLCNDDGHVLERL